MLNTNTTIDRMGKQDQTFSFDIVSCLLAALVASGGTVGNKQYALMAKIDGSKTQSGYEHLFRDVKKRARELNDQIQSGEIELGAAAAAGTPKSRKASKTPGTGEKEKSTGKRGRKAMTEQTDADDEEESPSKKKVKVKMEASDGEEEMT